MITATTSRVYKHPYKNRRPTRKGTVSFRANGSDWTFSNVVATFRQCLSPIVNKLSTRDKSRNFRQGLLVKRIQELAKPLTDSLVPGTLRWWAGVGNDRSIADSISGCYNIGQKLVEKEPLGLKYTQLIRSHTTARYQKMTCVY